MEVVCVNGGVIEFCENEGGKLSQKYLRQKKNVYTDVMFCFSGLKCNAYFYLVLIFVVFVAGECHSDQLLSE